jgi:predicted GTPase
MVQVIPVLGAPLVGKTTILLHLAKAFASRIEVTEFPVTDEVLGTLPVRRLEVTVLQDRIKFWCIPGGTLPGWSLRNWDKADLAIFVFDSQPGMEARNLEYFEPCQDRVSRWLTIATKADLSKGTLDLPGPLRVQPPLLINGLKKVSQTALQLFVLDVVVPRLNAA